MATVTTEDGSSLKIHSVHTMPPHVSWVFYFEMVLVWQPRLACTYRVTQAGLELSAIPLSQQHHVKAQFTEKHSTPKGSMRSLVFMMVGKMRTIQETRLPTPMRNYLGQGQSLGVPVRGYMDRWEDLPTVGGTIPQPGIQDCTEKKNLHTVSPFPFPPPQTPSPKHPLVSLSPS